VAAAVRSGEPIMWSDFKRAYADAARLMTALPLVFALPVVAELVQHWVEYRAGMFDSIAGAEAAGDDPARMAFGQIKFLSLLLVPFWITRWFFFRDDPDRPLLGDRRSVMLYIPVLLLSFVLALPQQFGGSLLSTLVPDPGTLMAIGFAYFLATLVLEIYLTIWKVGAALGNSGLTIPASLRIMHGNFWWSFGLYLLAFLPLMILHYGLFGLAVGRSGGLLWTLLVADSLVVGLLALVLPMASVLIARRAAERSGTVLAAA
jgi:hypothetical protein